MARQIVFTGRVVDALGQAAAINVTAVYDEGPIIDRIDIVRVGLDLDINIVARDPEGGALTYELAASEGVLVQDAQNPAHFVWSP